MKTAFFKCFQSKTLSFLGIGALAMTQTLFAAPTLVDINANDGRGDSHTPNAYNWLINSGTPSVTFNGLTFKLSKDGSAGSEIRAVNNKRLTKTDGSSPTLTQDGVTVKDADKGGRIKLEITGLSKGTHSINTYHSYEDGWNNGSPISITINGNKTASNQSVPTKVTNDWNARIIHSTFTANGTVTVLITPDDANKNGAVLNAFEIDGVDFSKSISKFIPKNGELHHETKNGLSWTAGSGANSHDVYLGTDYNAVLNATKSSPEFKGNQSGTNYNLTGNYSSLKPYYWRVDEVGSGGTVKGAVYSFHVARLAFPTAEGYGRFARGGRGGKIVEVTNLNDNGAGSLRQALEVEKGSRIVIFKVAGVIPLKSRLVVPADGGDVYIAGQTAPGPITLINYDFGTIGGQDIIFRHIRTRVGEMNGKSTGGMGLASADNTIIDHCSISWATDEGFSSRGAKNISFQWNIIGESLNNSVHYDGGDRSKTERHAFAASISGYVGSFHHNLLINNTGRNWSLAGGMEQDGITYGGNVDIRNNVVYNWKDRTTDGGVRRLNFVNNYYKAGQLSNTGLHVVQIDGNELNTYDWQMMYVSGNKMVANNGSVILGPNDNAWDKGKAKWGGKGDGGSVSKVRSNTQFFEPYVITESADQAYNSVTSRAGAGLGVKSQGWDYIDKRYIDEVKQNKQTLTGSRDKQKGFIDTQDDAGGYPSNSKFTIGTAYTDNDKDGIDDAWERSKGLDPSKKEDGSYTTLSADGYTNLEMFLNELAGDNVVYNGTGEQPSSSSGTGSGDPDPSSSSVTIGNKDGNLIRELTVSDSEHDSKWSIEEGLKTGDLVNSDRENTWVSLPESVTDAEYVEYIRTAIDPKSATLNEQATFKAGSDITVSVLLDSRVIEPTNGDDPRPIPAWLEGWTRVDGEANSSNEVKYYVYQKDFEEGETVTLGTNVTTQSVVNYTVVVKAKKGSTPILNTPISISNSGIAQYYNLRGESFGTTKPTKAGIYLIKQGSSVKKIVIK